MLTVSTVVHHTSIIVRSVQTLNVVPGVLVEVVFHTGLDVLPVDSNVIVSIITALLMPKADDMHQFVLTYAHVNATDAQRDQLHSSPFPDLGRTAIARVDVDEVVVRRCFRLETDACTVRISFHCRSQHCAISGGVLS